MWKILSFFTKHRNVGGVCENCLHSVDVANGMAALKRCFVANLLITMGGVCGIMPWLCDSVDHMIQQGVLPIGFSYTDPLAIQNHW